MELHGVDIVDTFAEAFPMSGTRLLITADTSAWANTAAQVLCGNATSVIACDIECALERELSPEETPDGRPGVSILAFAFSRDALATAMQNRVGQCVLTTPTTACFDGYPDGDPAKRISIGGGIRYFGDGYQISKKLGARRYWRIPVMDGEFLCEDKFGTVTGVAGGNLLICGRTGTETLLAAEAAVTAMRCVRDVIMPFPGGIVRSGSKVGSRYKKLKASTNDAYCPTLRGIVASELPEQASAVYEIVIDGLSFEAVQQAMRVGLHAAAQSPGVVQITAGNYGGKLGKHHFHLKDLV
ncbi:MAG: formylmethanofuran--tetrahydromethanopterin N-formyltransferase [Planctomycetaceae bacterium]|nr:formylmethanofuran--tetrahydromethanopterin N-formyltransferase [Planctomycetaceae bacterium]